MYSGCDGEFGTCSLTDFSASTWQPATQEYLLIDTVCTCTDDYLGANCTIPCPCAKGGFGKGTCAVDLAKLELDEYPDEELGICLCQDGYVGSDCTIPCPACVADQGTCQPPIGYEDGVGQTLVELSATFTGSTLALKIFEGEFIFIFVWGNGLTALVFCSQPPSTGRARATHPWRTCSAGSGTPETTARYLAGRAIWARASRTVRASVSRGIRDGGARTNATAPGSSYFPNLTRPTPTRTLITCRWCQVTPITTRAACLTCTSSTGFRRHLRTIRGRIARADTGETRFPTKLNRYRLTSCRSMPKTVKGTPGRSATFRVIRA